MSEEEKRGMYSRRNGASQHGTMGTRASQGTPGPSTTSPSGNWQGGATKPPQTEFALLQECGSRLGVSRMTLTRLYDRAELKAMDDVEKRLTSIQLARLGACGTERARAYEQLDETRNLMEYDEETMAAALTVKPVDTVEQFLDLNSGMAPVREALEMVKACTPITPDLIEEKPEVAELVVLFQELLEQDVDLILSSQRQNRNLSMRTMRELGERCIQLCRKLTLEAKRTTRRSQLAQPEDNTPMPEEPPKRITKSSMGSYYNKLGANRTKR
jgi:hypothetical protein